LDELPVILVVEDDPIIQNLIEVALSDGGFEVDVVSTGEEALTLLSADGKTYRALVTDINLLGRLDGWEVGRRAREIDGNSPVVYVSGDSVGDWASKGVPNSVMLSKPFAPAQLVTAVSQLLNSGSPAT
jgi:DNA-binding response OmpR family regulator